MTHDTERKVAVSGFSSCIRRNEPTWSTKALACKDSWDNLSNQGFNEDLKESNGKDPNWILCCLEKEGCISLLHLIELSKWDSLFATL